VEAVLRLLVDVPRAWLRPNRAGLWHSVRDIPPDLIRRVLSFAELAGQTRNVYRPEFGEVLLVPAAGAHLAWNVATTTARWLYG
jgi:hypothetical protein